MRRLIGLVVLGVLVPGSVVADPLHFDDRKRWITLPFDSPATGSLVLFGQVTDPKKADVVYYNYQRGEAYLARSTGQGFGPLNRVSVGLPIFSGNKIPTVGLVDVDGDKHADLVILNQGPDDVPGAATAVVARWNGQGFQYPANSTWNASWCADYQICLFGDLNHDGKADMVAFTPNFGTLWGSLSTGTAFGANSIWNNFFCIKGEVCALGDVDGDGKTDAIAFKPTAPPGQKGNVLYARSNGSGFSGVTTGHGYFCIDQERCLVGDVNGDGKTDIVLVKGMGNPTLEVLVSLSNGHAFINANPFDWAHPGYFNQKSHGTFVLADVNGDGKADLIEYGAITKENGPGSYTTIGTAIDVMAATDRAPTRPTPPPPPPSLGGFGSVLAYNCHPNQNRLSFYTFDLATGGSSKIGPVDAMYAESGFCPDPGDTPQTLPLADGHAYTIVAVDPGAIGCEGQDDPNVVACRNAVISVLGKGSGPACRWIIGAQAPACN